MSQSTNTQTSSAGEVNKVDTAAVIADAQGAAALAEAGGVPSSAASAATKINSLEDLQKLSPELYNEIVVSIAQNMMIDFKNREDRLEKEMKKMQGDEY
jgi:hypothetical protein